MPGVLLILTVLLAISTIQFLSLILILVGLFLGFKIAESSWSFRISKPHLFEAAIRKGEVSKKLQRIERFYRDKVRFYTIWFQIRRLNKQGIAGAFAEVGVYKGETARMIHAMDPTRKFYLFDTFSGFDEKEMKDGKQKNEIPEPIDFSDTSVDAVLKFIDGNENIAVFPGRFPETVVGLPDEKYALVHLDADLYEPTWEALKYFYPRLSAGGIIIIHDYNHNWEGVKRAIDEFRNSIPENLTEVPDWQGSVVLVKNRS